MTSYPAFQLCYGVPVEINFSTGFLTTRLERVIAKPVRQAAQQNRAVAAPMDFEQFLKQVEKRAYRLAYVATSDVEEALDIVQDAMLLLASKYAKRNADEWPPLFHRILQNRIRDWYRRQKIRNALRGWLGGQRDNDDEADDGIESVADETAYEPARILDGQQSLAQLQTALNSLPIRQQQTFLLRAWEGLDVNQTAAAMGITTGSVKTHYSRAIHALQEMLGVETND